MRSTRNRRWRKVLIQEIAVSTLSLSSAIVKKFIDASQKRSKMSLMDAKANVCKVGYEALRLADNPLHECV